MGIKEIIIKTLTDTKINTAIISTLAIIFLGYYCRKKKLFNDNTGKVLSKLILTVSLPALAFISFMGPIDFDMFRQGMNVLIWGLLIYIVLIVITIPFYKKYKGDEKDTLRVLSIFGATTSFGIPIVTAVYGIEGTLYASIFNIGYRVFLYSYAYIKMSGEKFTKENIKAMFLNPIVIATLLGLLIWIFQEKLPQVKIQEFIDLTNKSEVSSYAFLRLDKTFPQLFQVLKYLAGLFAPLAWLSIGSTLGSIDLKQAVKDKTVWYYTFIKLVILPLINLMILMVLSSTNILPLSKIALGSIMIMVATPPATVAVAYSISFDKCSILSSNASLLATIMAVILMPVWIILIQLLNNFDIFI